MKIRIIRKNKIDFNETHLIFADNNYFFRKKRIFIENSIGLRYNNLKKGCDIDVNHVQSK